MQKRTEIDRKSTKQNNELQYVRQNYVEWYNSISFIKERIPTDSTVSNNTFRVVTQKYLSLTLLHCWHSRSILIIVNAQLQESIMMVLLSAGQK